MCIYSYLYRYIYARRNSYIIYIYTHACVCVCMCVCVCLGLWVYSLRRGAMDANVSGGILLWPLTLGLVRRDKEVHRNLSDIYFGLCSTKPYATDIDLVCCAMAM